MSELKTQENDGDVTAFLEGIEHIGRREDALVLRGVMERVSGCPARMWGDAIVGFDRYEYKQRNGTPGAWPMTGFSPRKANLVVYVMPGVAKYGPQLDRLGPHKHSVSCLYLGRLEKIDMTVLEELIAVSLADMRANYA